MFKLTSSLVKTAFSAVKPSRFAMAPKYLFATGPKNMAPSHEKPAQTKLSLKDQVENEIKYENENIPDETDLKTIIANEKWTLNSRGLFHELTKKVGDNTVNVTFFSRPPSSSNEPEEGEVQQTEQEQMPEYFEFTVYVRKGTNPQTMYADFIVSEGEVTIGGLSFTGDYESHKSMSKFERSVSSYQGPDLETLDESLVEAISDHFQSLGLNQQVINFIEQYSLSSEHQFYRKWLEQLKTYV